MSQLVVLMLYSLSKEALPAGRGFDSGEVVRATLCGVIPLTGEEKRPKNQSFMLI